jgi:hypothetical protein
VCLRAEMHMCDTGLLLLSRTHIQLPGVGTVASVNSPASFWHRLDKRLGWRGWASVGVILDTVLSLVGYFLASGNSSSSSQIITVHGSCNAAVSGNTVACAQPSSRAEP